MKKQHAIKMRYKFVASIFLFVLLFLICHANVYAADIYIPEVLKDTYVYDSASILSNETEKTVNEKLDKLEEDTSAEIVVITIPSLNGIPIEDYANKEFNTLGIGKEETNNGVLLLISTEEPRVRIEVGKGLEWTLTDSISGRILDNHFVEYRANGDYDMAVIETVDAMAELVETEANREPGFVEKVNGFVEKLNNEISRRWNSLSGFDKLCAMPMIIVAAPFIIIFLIAIPFIILFAILAIILGFINLPVYVYYHILRKDKLPEYEARLKEREEKRKKKEEEREAWEKAHHYDRSSSNNDSSWWSSSSSSSWGSSSHSSGSFGGGSSGGGGASR